MGDKKRIGYKLRTNRARNRTAIRTQIRTRVDGPLHGRIYQGTAKRETVCRGIFPNSKMRVHLVPPGAGL
jgi:hypothetical protein